MFMKMDLHSVVHSYFGMMSTGLVMFYFPILFVVKVNFLIFIFHKCLCDSVAELCHGHKVIAGSLKPVSHSILHVFSNAACGKLCLGN